ncbi:MAG: polyribonucleotide nucleotidyltransferase [Synechococcus sp.]|uniref:Polyribonucleotide nucleotidyltransferase n=1 Tax=Synechococcus sp. (strain WH7803) TaxID=32051 RepID=PNP_SYNPW|nr:MULTISPECIES: polyribonucleotide nucleotidyltransferase [unclassified Synechococcus]A5GN19.1 RecName: Full=Polyribonucleotide nucleotidyltransferase; AltName: Full=Polynucleotide phosphorylase; Short=PNPase [Synechococcus sp. WH 7803]MCT0251309.1 polyribonucleotide nucleotidyltransferase [Synechococcus sp. CS-197]QNI68310.1 polyribonucleotide nucleotidyltransferase [Synechococcus sp. BMK-MC-1]CAK24334.1 Polyribonucleotide nucleotidyltransferase [Synechococcus sp. WH 7803]
MQGQTQSISFDGREIRLTTGRYAPQAGGSVMIECGDTSVLVTATRSSGREGIDFLPLICDYEERLYAAGRIPGSFMRREGRPPERATLISRLIDRPMRPLFPSWLRDDLQIVATCMSLDERVPADVLSVTGASMATLLAGIPFYGPMAAVRVGLLGDDFVLNPSYREIERGDLDLVVAGTPEGIVMVEAGANQLPEQDVIEAIDFGYEAVCELIKAQESILKDAGIEQVKPEQPEEDSTLPVYLEKACTKAIGEVLSQFDQSKADRDSKLDAIRSSTAETIEALKDSDPVRKLVSANSKALPTSFKALTKKLMRQQIVKDGKRVDGRSLDQVRPISAAAGVLPKRVHGSGLFQRGLTQVLSTATLGTPSDAQEMDDLNPSTEKTYLHHYNFPPYSVGETKPMRSPGRREIGHGALAERAILPVLPAKDTFPYVVRVVSEVLSSNGSTSMGSVCGSTLALMDAGVPLKAPVSGAAMGLIKEGDEVRILTDIQGIEDFLGDMDFKVAGTDKGITALQMDMKITGLAMGTIAEAINQARPARLHILEKMMEAIDTPRDGLSPHAPRLLSFRIDPELIGTVIGPGGRTIKGITERTNTKIDIEDSGIVTIASHDGAAADEAQKIIEGLTRKVNEGEVFSGAITRIIPIGAFVEILPGKEGMIHISQLSEARVEKVEDVVKVGDEVTVRVREIDNRGRINLTLRGVPQNGEEAEPAPAPTPVAPLN